MSRQMADQGRTHHGMWRRGDEIRAARREHRQLRHKIESSAGQEAEAGLPYHVGQSAGVDVVLDLARFETAGRPAEAPASTGVRHEGER